MRAQRYCAVSASLLLALAAGSPALAESGPSVEFTATTVAAGVGGGSGEGNLMLPNLGTGCTYPFKVEGFGAGIQLGVSKMTAKGAVKNLTKIADLPGGYSSTGAEATLVKGGGVLNLKNQRNDVGMELKSQTEGVSLGVGAQGITIKLAKALPEPQRVFVLYYGFNKDHVNKESRDTLATVIDGWKCRYANFELVGHTDTVGTEEYNVELSERRANAARDFLVNAGIVPGRISTRAAGKTEPLLDTGEGVRKRPNRVVVVQVKPSW
ncbi:MAG: OmpA family protein [Alphaproteobacteria bacterium]|nr:OmpA family protein [Alphaproteobacteria bacterium]